MNAIRGTAVLSVAAALAFASPAVLAQEEFGDEDAVVAQAEEVQMLQLQANPKFIRMQMKLAVDAALVRRVCELSEGQETDLAKLDDRWLTKLLDKKVPPVQQGVFAAFFGARPNQGKDVQTVAVSGKIDDALNSILDDDQRAVFAKEKEQRDQFRNESIAEALVESLHERLDMTEQQREQISKKLIPWVAKRDIVVMYYFGGNNNYPDIPIHFLDSLPNEQKEIYRGLQKHLFTMGEFRDGNVPIVIER